MNDQELDRLLLQARPEVSVAAQEEARKLARTTTSPPPRRSVRSRRRLAIPVGLATAALVAGAGTLTAYQLGVPPFQTLEPGLARSYAVPVEWRTDAGTLVSCDAFLEFSDQDPGQRDRINAMIAEGDWQGYGQQLYDALPAADKDVQTGPGPVGPVVSRDLARRAIEASAGPVTGGAMSCAYPEGAPADER